MSTAQRIFVSIDRRDPFGGRLGFSTCHAFGREQRFPLVICETNALYFDLTGGSVSQEGAGAGGRGPGPAVRGRFGSSAAMQVRS